MKIPYIKGHGSGNDFILIDIRSFYPPLSMEQKRDWAIKLCNRETSIGADGVLFVTDARKGDGCMRIFNADGSEAEMCGNGIRLVGRYVAETAGKKEVLIQNVTALDYPIHHQSDFFEGVEAYQVKLPPASFKPSDIPFNTVLDPFIDQPIPSLSENQRFTALALPNPHLISYVDTIDFNLLESMGKQVNEDKSLFPQGMNLSFVKLLDEKTVFVATYERGVGITNACGTAMCSSVISGIALGKLPVDTTIKVINRGGFIEVKVLSDGYCLMTGNATFEYQSYFHVGEDGAMIVGGEKEVFTLEKSAYDQLVTSLPVV
jgi:diaminopimelate epimerase